MLTATERQGAVFKDEGRVKELVRLMKDNGCNCFRVRLFVNPTGRGGVIQDVPYVIDLARRIKQSGSLFVLDLHYSDTWADPGKQFKPKAWGNLHFNDLVSQIETYTADVISQFKKENLLPDIVQIGNEIDGGFLWPEAQLYLKDADREVQLKKFAKLLKAAIRGLKKAIGPSSRVQIMIHISSGGNKGRTEYFFKNIESQKIPYDIIGLSYYPWWHGTIDDLKANFEHTANLFNKDILLAETAFPYHEMSFGRAPFQGPFFCPVSIEGQKEFLDQVIETVQSTPNNHGLGVLWWYPESVPIENQWIWNGGATALFDKNGNALPSMRSFAVNKAKGNLNKD